MTVTVGAGDASPAATVAVEAREITKSYDATQALVDVSLRVRHGVSHALVGRNGAGKSTLVAILTGLLAPDDGVVLFEGEEAPALVEREHWRERVACVYQRSTVIESLSVAENLFLNAFPGSNLGVVHWRDIRRRARRLLEEWGIEVDADAPASALTVGERQLVEIARALRLGSRFIILDEPTAQLEAREIEQLFARMRSMQAGGVTFLYISHHLDEIYETCHEVTVLRDGRRVLNADVTDVTQEELVEAMVGPGYVAPTEADPRAVAADTDRPLALDIRHLSVAGACEDVSLQVAAGECVGLAGLAGSGTAEIADAVIGLIAPTGGEVWVAGQILRPGRVDQAIKAGVGYVPADRHARGFSPNLSLEENLTASILDRLGSYGLVSPGIRRDRASSLIEQAAIVASSPAQLTSELSGGNQQKTVMGRALASEPMVLVLVHPTAGVDIAAKQTLLRSVLESDRAVLMVSDELDELAVCDRVVVVFDGRVTHEFEAGWDGAALVSAIEGMPA